MTLLTDWRLLSRAGRSMRSVLAQGQFTNVDRYRQSKTPLSWTRAIAPLSAVALVAIVVLLLFGESLPTLDRYVSSAVQSLRTQPVDYLMIVITSVADTEVLLTSDVAIVALLIFCGSRREAAFAASTLVSCELSVKAMKWWIERERPITDLYDGISAFSFPSGHAANVAATTIVLLVLAQSLSPGRCRNAVIAGLVTLATFVGLSRVYLQAHWPSDIVAGFLLATGVAALSYSFLKGTSLSGRPDRFWLSLGIWAVASVAYITSHLGDQLHMYGVRASIAEAGVKAAARLVS